MKYLLVFEITHFYQKHIVSFCYPDYNFQKHYFYMIVRRFYLFCLFLYYFLYHYQKCQILILFHIFQEEIRSISLRHFIQPLILTLYLYLILRSLEI